MLIFYLGKEKIGTIVGIKSLHEWTWPDQGEDIGFVYVRILPEIGEWKKWSPAQIERFKNKEKMKNPTQNILPIQNHLKNGHYLLLLVKVYIYIFFFCILIFTIF